MTLLATHRSGNEFGVELTLSQGTPGGAVLWARPASETDRDEPEPDVFRTIFERAPEGITILDEHGLQRTVNPAGLRMVGLRSGMERAGFGLGFVHPDDLHPFEDRARRRAAGEDVRDEPFRYRVSHADGSWRWLESITVDLRDVPPVSGFVVLSRDVTEAQEQRLALEEATARLDAFVRALPEPTLLTDVDGMVVLANEATATLCEVEDAGALTGRVEPHLDALRSAAVDGDSVVDRLERRGPGSQMASGGDVRLHDGRHLEVDVVPVRTTDGRELGTFWLLRDVTSLRLDEQRRAELLDLEQAARTAAEDHARRLQQFDEYRNRVLAAVSHELRTPLTSILSASEHLETDPVDTAEMRTYAGLIRRNASRLDVLVADLLVVGRLQSGTLPMEFGPVDVPALLDQVAQIHLNPAGPPVDVEATDGPPARADALRLSQVVGNLVANGLKFGDEDGVRVRARHDDGVWTITVSDHGVGIRPDDRERVFDEFYRSTSTEAVAGGSGLGLSIAKGIVELHGGTIRMAPAADGGTEATVTIPDWRAADG